MRQEHTQVGHVLLPLAVLLERRRQGCRFAIELPPEVSGPAADATQQGVRLQLAVDAAFAPDNTGILAQEHMRLLWIPVGKALEKLNSVLAASKAGGTQQKVQSRSLSILSRIYNKQDATPV